MLKRLWIVLSIGWALCAIGIGFELDLDQQATRESLARSAAERWAPGPAAEPFTPPPPAGAIPISAQGIWPQTLAVAFAPFVGGPILAWIAAWVWAGRKRTL